MVREAVQGLPLLICHFRNFRIVFPASGGDAGASAGASAGARKCVATCLQL